MECGAYSVCIHEKYCFAEFQTKVVRTGGKVPNMEKPEKSIAIFSIFFSFCRRHKKLENSLENRQVQVVSISRVYSLERFFFGSTSSFCLYFGRVFVMRQRRRRWRRWRRWRRRDVFPPYYKIREDSKVKQKWE